MHDIPLVASTESCTIESELGLWVGNGSLEVGVGGRKEGHERGG